MPARIVDGVIYSPLPDFDTGGRTGPQLIRERLRRFPEKVIAMDATESITAGELLAKMERNARAFWKLGVKPGSHVCVHVRNTIQNFAAVFGLVFAGATVVLSKPTLVLREVLHQVQDSDCNYIFTDTHGKDKILELSKYHSFERLLIFGDATGFTNVETFHDPAEPSHPDHVPAILEEDVMAILYTSGSTGQPKGVQISHKSFVFALTSLEMSKFFAEDEVLFGWGPLTHTSGFGLNISSMTMGTPTVLREPDLPLEDLLDVLEANKVSHLIGFPLGLRAMMNVIKETKRNVRPIKKIFTSGGPLAGSITQTLKSIFAAETIMNIYSCTEAFCLITATPLGEVARDNVGVPGPGCKIKIVDLETGQTMGPFEHGEIWIQCGSVMRGYYGHRESTQEVLTGDGWLRSGDLGYYDEDGRLYLVERLKDMIKCMDKQVAPFELEQLLRTHPAVKEVAVVGVPHSEYGQAPAACVVLETCCQTPPDMLKEELKKLVADKTAVFKHLYGGVFFVKALPKIAVGKVSKRDILSKLANGEIV